MKVSFCVPVYNTEPLLTRCLDSIVGCGLKLKDYEILVVNDGDGQHEKCKEILNNYKKTYPELNLNYFIHLNNSGLLEARKTAVMNAKGEYICIVDSDDYIVAGSIGELYKVSDNFDIIQGNFNIIGPRMNIPYPCSFDTSNKTSLIKDYLLTQSIFGYLWGKLIKKSVYKKALDELPDEYINFAEDFLQMFFICKNSHTYKCVANIDIYVYDRSNKSITNSKSFSIDKVKQLILSYSSIMNILNPKNFNNLELQERTKHFHIKYLKEIYSCVLLIDDKKSRDIMVKLFIKYFGPETTENINKMFLNK